MTVAPSERAALLDAMYSCEPSVWFEKKRGPGAAWECGHYAEGEMIELISYVVIAFCYRKANILCRWSNILRIFYGNKGLWHGCRSY